MSGGCGGLARSGLLLLLLLSGFMPAAASASTEVARPYLVDGPQLADGRVFFMTPWGIDGYALRVVGPDGQVQTVGRGKEAGPAASHRYSFEVAPGRFGVQGSRIHFEPDKTSDPSAGLEVEYHRSRLLVGQTPDSLAPVAGCSGQGTGFPYAVATRFVAFIDECRSSELSPEGSPHLRYLDFSSGAGRRRTVSLPSGRFIANEFTDRLRVAGRWAAVDATVPNPGPPPPYAFFPTVVVDLDAGGEAYRVERYRAPDSGPSGGAAIDADGTLVTISGDVASCEGTLAFHTLADPSPHPLPGRACGPALEIDNGAFLFSGAFDGQPAVMLGDTSGAAPRPLAILHHGYVFDIEGDRAVYAYRTCGGATAIRVASLAEETPFESPRERLCPVELLSRRLRLGPKGRGELPLSCPRGCQVSARLRVPPKGTRRHTVRTVAGGYATSRGPKAVLRFEVRPGERPFVPVGITRARLELVADNLTGRDTTIRARVRLRVPRPISSS